MAEEEPTTRLKVEREKRKMTQAELADAVGVPPNTASRWERGEQIPRPDSLRNLTALFGIEVDATWFQKESTETSSSPLWNVPYYRNPYFVGDENLLSGMHDRLVAQKERTSILTVSGIGGIGKTQLALEYAYKYRDDYRAVFWLRADTLEQLDEDLENLGNLLQVPETHRRKPNQQYIINETKGWLRSHPRWLLVLDNVDEKVKIKSLLTELEGGHVLMTTRTQIFADLAQNLPLDKMKPDDGALLILRRAHMPSASAILAAASASNRRGAMALSRLLGGLPLALDQAAAYIQETECGLFGYMQLYRKYHKDLLSWRSTHENMYSDYEASVATTWLISFKRIEEQCSAASDLLRLCAFLYADAIPEAIVIEGARLSGSEQGSVADNKLAFNRACGVLLSYSMLRRNATDKMFSMHCLVQQILKDRMVEEGIYKQWAMRAVLALDQAFSPISGQYIEQYIPHVRSCARLIKDLDLKGQEVAHLLEQAAVSVRERGWYAQARPLYLKAHGAATDLLGKDDPRVLRLLLDAVRAHMEVGVYGMATIVCPKIREDCERVLGPDHPDIVACLNLQALAEMKQLNFPYAVQICKQALAWHGRVQGAYPAERAMTYHIAAGVYASHRADTLALRYYQQARMIREQVFGSESSEVADSLTDLGIFYLARNMFVEAEPLFRQALEIRRKVLGLDHPDTASCLEHLAMISWCKDDYSQAEELCKQALAIRLQKLGRYHPDIAQNIRGLAVLAAEQGRDDEAEGHYRESLKIYLNAGGPLSLSYLFVLIDFADFLRLRGRASEAEKCDQEVAAATKRLERGEHMLSFVLDQGDEEGQSWPTQMWFLRRPDMGSL